MWFPSLSYNLKNNKKWIAWNNGKLPVFWDVDDDIPKVYEILQNVKSLWHKESKVPALEVCVCHQNFVTRFLMVSKWLWVEERADFIRSTTSYQGLISQMSLPVAYSTLLAGYSLTTSDHVYTFYGDVVTLPNKALGYNEACWFVNKLWSFFQVQRHS